jgi:hypothetical protein
MNKPVTKGRLQLSVLPQVWHAVRPADCASGSEPCPMPDECRYHLSNPAHPEVSCAIDLADDGALSLVELGRVLGVTNEMVCKIQRRALRKLKAKGLSVFAD